MRNAIALAFVLASTTVASAQPVTRSCAVTIARAPDDVRIVVDAWVAAEPACGTPLEVRIVPTEGGLYILARDDQGRVRERIVPDAQSAGVLIASWAADDAIATPPPVAPAPAATPVAPVSPSTPAPAPVAPAIAPGAPPFVPAGPGMMPPSPPGAIAVPVVANVDGPPMPPPPRRISKWLSAGVLFGDSEDTGLRVELDVLTRGKWSFGVAGSASLAHVWVDGYNESGQLTTADKKLTATVTRTMQRGRFQLRASAGLGFVYSDARAELYPYTPQSWGVDYASGSTVTSVADASLVLGVELGKRWALTGGPIVTLFDQTFEMQSFQMSNTQTLRRGNLELMGSVGLRYRL